jgi:hypothetical protein
MKMEFNIFYLFSSHLTQQNVLFAKTLFLLWYIWKARNDKLNAPKEKLDFLSGTQGGCGSSTNPPICL